MTIGAALAAAALPVAAQDAGRPIRLLVGFAPGGGADMVARVIADKLRGVLNQPVIVENRAGAGGRLASEALKNAPPDGLTYMVAPNATAVFQHLLYSPAVLKYDQLADLTPVATLTTYPLALAVNAKTGIGDLKQFVAWVKANPKQANFGTAGLGGHTHFSGEQLGKATGVDLVAVPYRGNGPLVTDLVGGQLPVGILVAGDIVQHQKSGTVKVIGVLGAKRSPLLPEVPTLKEQGVDLDTGDAWMGLWANAKTPKAELDRMQAAVRQVLAMPDVRETLAGRATMNPEFRGAVETDQALRREIGYWGQVIKASGFTPDQ